MLVLVSFNTCSLQVCRVMCVTGYFSVQQATSVRLSLALQTIAVPPFATSTTATTMASVHTTQNNFQSAGKNTLRHSCSYTDFVSLHPSEKVVSMSSSSCLCVSCLVGEDFWYMGQRCDVRMTRVRLVGACLAILIIMVTVIGVLALVAVRRYRAILIQAKVDQTRSRYAPTH